MPEWTSVTLTDLLEPTNERVHDQPIELVLSVTEKRGIIPQSEVFTKRVATADVTKYKVLRPLDIAYNPYLLWTGAVGQWLGDQPGATSPVYECFRAKPAHDPRFVGLLLESGLLTPYFNSTAVGSIQRRRRTTPSVFLAAEFSVPNLDRQRRIVNLTGALDAQIEALTDEAAAAARMEGPLIQTLVVEGAEGAEPLRLGQVGEFIRGRRFTKDDYVPSGLGCIHYGQVHTHFRPVATQSLTFLPEEWRSRLRLATPGDVVIAGTSEDVEGLGKATVWLGDDDVAVHDDCYIFRHRLDPKFAAYVFGSPWFQDQKRQYADGTKVTRISAADLASIEIPIPAMTVQTRIGNALHGVSAHVDALREELDALRTLRATLLAALLSRRAAVPESYDLLLQPRALELHSRTA